MNRVVFNSPCGRINDVEIDMATVPVHGDLIDFPRHGIFHVAGRKYDLSDRKWKVAVSR